MLVPNNQIDHNCQLTTPRAVYPVSEIALRQENPRPNQTDKTNQLAKPLQMSVNP